MTGIEGIETGLHLVQGTIDDRANGTQGVVVWHDVLETRQHHEGALQLFIPAHRCPPPVSPVRNAHQQVRGRESGHSSAKALGELEARRFSSSLLEGRQATSSLPLGPA